MRVCMIVRTPPAHTPPEHTTGKREDSGKAEKPAYIGNIAGNEKSIKKVKKNLEIRKNRRIFVAVIKNQSNMKTTNNTIFENIHERGYMTEKEMQLLKNRSNKAQKDLFNYDLDLDGYGIKLDEEWANKGLQWLKSLLKKNGEPKAGQNLGYREIEIIKTATASEFKFVYFYDNGNGWHRNYLPVYNVAGMEYYVSGGFIQVVG